MGIKHYLLFFFPSLFFFQAHGREADTVEAQIAVQFIREQAVFTAELPVLQGIPGGRQPFYTYLWDFGDGHFSTAEAPTHVYTKSGDYDVTLYTVSNYDNGPRPKRPTRKVRVEPGNTGAQKVTSAAEQHFFSSNGIFQLTKNANALPGEDMVVVAGIKTKEKGKVFLLTNEKIFESPGFVYTGQSTYNGEQLLQLEDSKMLQGLWAAVPGATVTQSGSPDYGIREELQFTEKEAISYFSDLYGSYNTVTAYDVDAATDAQFSLINLAITPEMLTDTNATVTITGVFLPETGPATVHRLDVPIVTSHDPNKMSLKQSRLSYRALSRRKELTYKVQFQNDGEGDAKNIRLEIELPEALDPATFKLLNLYPAVDSCATEGLSCYQYHIKGVDTLVFQFNNIALPGSKAPDVHDKDSTRGFIRFTVQPRKKLPNRPFRGQTNIFFDKNEPITTNFATGRFRKGFSPIVFAGYHHFLQSPEREDIGNVDNPARTNLKNGALLGVGLAPIAPYRKLYWQVELYANTYSFTESRTIFEYGTIQYRIPDSDRIQTVEYERYDRDTETKYLQLRIVPLHIRYNFNSWFSAGLGALANVTFNTSHREERTYNLILANGETTVQQPQKVDRLPASRLGLQPFVDFNFGRTYLGPVLGLRYVYGGNQGQFGQLYAAWRL
ncbi:PKD domain-containing protein [Parapedobacter lycopersici]|uniref:DUF7849 domain-containing protein n=1 Tax=Parapedobacter lycopersici TaxID=1864939 RepID=UPI00333EFAC2